LDELYTATEPSKGEEKQKYNCECIKCGYKMTSDEHCDKLKCPKCGGDMRRSSRPGPGKTYDNKEELEKEYGEIIVELERRKNEKG